MVFDLSALNRISCESANRVYKLRVSLSCTGYIISCESVLDRVYNFV